MRIAYTVAALGDLYGIADYLTPLNPSGAAKVEADIRSAVDRLADFPLSGAPQDEVGVRKAVSPSYRYRVFYTVDTAADVVTILSILHPSRR